LKWAKRSHNDFLPIATSARREKNWVVHAYMVKSVACLMQSVNKQLYKHRSITFGQQQQSFALLREHIKVFLRSQMQFTVTFAKQRGTPAQSLFGAAL